MLMLWLFGSGWGLSILTIRGILKAFPKIIHTPGFRFFISFISLSLISGKISEMNFKSLGWNILKIKKLLHWLIAVSLSSKGLWLTKPRITPYFLPSFAIRSKMLYPSISTSLSFWTYLWASSNMIWNGRDPRCF